MVVAPTFPYRTPMKRVPRRTCSSTCPAMAMKSLSPKKTLSWRKVPVIAKGPRPSKNLTMAEGSSEIYIISIVLQHHYYYILINESSIVSPLDRQNIKSPKVVQG